MSWVKQTHISATERNPSLYSSARGGAAYFALATCAAYEFEDVAPLQMMREGGNEVIFGGEDRLEIYNTAQANIA